MYQMMLNRKNSRKGFTLVEVIVVLVILAILAAIMVPAMTGWIDEAKHKAVVVNARTALLAAQTLESEEYGIATEYKGKAKGENLATGDAYEALAGSKVTGTLTYATDDTAQITGASYVEGTQTATYDGTTWKIGDTPAGD